MAIQNTENTLAAALGVSGVVSRPPGIYPVTPLTMVYRRQVTPADALFSAVSTQAGVALAEQTLSLKEGQWVMLDSSGNAIVATDATTAAIGPVWSGGDRLDPKGGVTVLHGPWIAMTTYFNDAGSYAVGTFLQIGTASVQGVAAQTGALTPITLAAFGDIFKVVAVVEKAPFGLSPEAPNGVLQIRRTIL